MARDVLIQPRFPSSTFDELAHLCGRLNVKQTPLVRALCVYSLVYFKEIPTYSTAGPKTTIQVTVPPKTYRKLSETAYPPALYMEQSVLHCLRLLNEFHDSRLSTWLDVMAMI